MVLGLTIVIAVAGFAAPSDENIRYVTCFSLPFMSVYAEVKDGQAVGEGTPVGCGQKVALLSESNGWSRVRVNAALEGYVSGFFLAGSPSAPTTSGGKKRR
jgi:hypothetical protein